MKSKTGIDLLANNLSNALQVLAKAFDKCNTADYGDKLAQALLNNILLCKINLVQKCVKLLQYMSGFGKYNRVK